MLVNATEVRQYVAQALTDALDPTRYVVYPYAYVPPNMTGTRGVVVVDIKSVARGTDTSFKTATSTLHCHVLEPLTLSAAAEDSLGERLNDVMEVFRRNSICTFKSAERTVVGGFEAWTITVETIHGV